MQEAQNRAPDGSQPSPQQKALACWYAQGPSDALGDRLLMFDNSTAPSLELLRLRPDFASAPGFEAALRERVRRLREFKHSAFARVRAVEFLERREGLAVISNYTPGQRLSEVLEQARGPARATTLIRELAPALVMLQQHGAGLAHGVLGVDRIVVSPEGRLTIVEHVLGSAIETLGLPASQLATIGVAVPPGRNDAPVQLDGSTDLFQLGLVAVSVLVGRRLGADDHPHVEGLLDHFAHSARRDGYALSPFLRRWLQRALQIGGERFESGAHARETSEELRDSNDGARSGAIGGTTIVAPAVVVPAIAASEVVAPAAAVTSVAAPAVVPATVVPPVVAAQTVVPTADVAPAAVPPAVAPLRVVAPTAVAPTVVAPTVVAATVVAATVVAPTVVPVAVAPPMAVAPAAAAKPVASDAAVSGRVASARALDTAERAEAGTPSPSSVQTRTILPAASAARPATLNRPAPAPTGPGGQPAVRTAASQPAVARRTLFDSEPARPAAPRPTAKAADRAGNRSQPGRGRARSAGETARLRAGGWSRTSRSALTALALLAGAEALVIGILVYRSSATPQSPIVVDAGPSGAIVRLDGRPADATPLRLTVAPDLRWVRLVSPSTRPAGARSRPGAPGGIQISSPIELQVFESGRLLGAVPGGRLDLAAGRHEIELVSSALGYRQRQAVDVEAGQLISIYVAPLDGWVNVDAAPWADVSIDGKPAGRTPLVSVLLPPGEHEFAFHHPQLGDDRLKAIVKSDAITRVTANLHR